MVKIGNLSISNLAVGNKNIDLPYVGDPKNYTSNLYFSKYIESFEYRIVAAGIDSGF